jgi:uncharacterized membrane protein (GlpM family)
MAHLSMVGMLIRFLLGGGAVLVSSLIAKKIGGRVGGIFAAFPAVYLAALVTIHFDSTGNALIQKSILLSQGAVVGMAINILCAVMAGYLCTKEGWKRGLMHSVFGWLSISMFIAFLSNHIS